MSEITHQLAAHPSPAPGELNFTFNSEAEQLAYIKYESALCIPHIRNLGASITKAEREKAKDELATRRKAIYKRWQDRNKPQTKGLA